MNADHKDERRSQRRTQITKMNPDHKDEPRSNRGGNARGNADQTEEGTHEGTYPLQSLPRRRRLQPMQHTLHHGIVRARLRGPNVCPVDRRGSAAVGTTNNCERTFVIAGAACASTMYSTDIQQLSTPCNNWSPDWRQPCC